MLAKLQEDDTIQRMARDLRNQGVEFHEVADATGTPRVHYALEASAEYYEERGGKLDAKQGDIATAILTLAFTDEDR